MRAVLDTNIIVSHTLAPRGPIAAIFGYWISKTFDLVVSEAILEEYKATLKKPAIQAHHRQSDAAIALLIRRLRTLAIVVTPTEPLTVVANDPDDNKIIECAMEAMPTTSSPAIPTFWIYRHTTAFRSSPLPSLYPCWSKSRRHAKKPRNPLTAELYLPSLPSATFYGIPRFSLAH